MDFPTKTYIDSKLGDVSGVKDVMNPANERDGTGPTVNILARDLTNAQYAGATQRGGEIQINGVKYDIDLARGGIGRPGVGHDCSTLTLREYSVAKQVSRGAKHCNLEGRNA